MSAGPGYGKTLTLASWSHSQAAPGRLAWLSLDETDNDVRAFWSDVLGSLAIAGVLPKSSTLREVMHASTFGSREAQLVRTALAEIPAIVTLVLDDFHLISDTRVQESVGHLLEHQPPQLRLVLATRFDPALRLNRLRVNGDLTDFRADDLAFTRDEAAELLHRNDVHLTEHELGILLDHTQGWAAGLRLVLMRLDPMDLDRGIAHVIGRNRLVAEYLIEEVIDRLTAVDRQFLLQTSVADRISGPLADELTGRGDGQVVLERLMIQNTLLVGLGANNEWFIVHPMLRAVLSHRLAIEQPGAVRELHLRSSRWFALHDEPIHAVRHAVAAEDWDEVGRLLTGTAWPELLTLQRFRPGFRAATRGRSRTNQPDGRHTARRRRPRPAPAGLRLHDQGSQFCGRQADGNAGRGPVSGRGARRPPARRPFPHPEPGVDGIRRR